MDVIDRILEIVTDGLRDLEGGQAKLSSVIRKAMRIARLRNDHENLYWLELETYSVGNEDAKRRIINEVASHFPKERFVSLQALYLKIYADERKLRDFDERGRIVDQEKIMALSVEEIENRINSLEQSIAASIPPKGLHPVDLYFLEKERTEVRIFLSTVKQDAEAILSRIRQRVHDFLSSTEKQLIFGQINSDIFEQNRAYVETRLRDLAPDALSRFGAIYRRLGDDDPESRSQALTSCRRILAAFADRVYPATEDKKVGADGKERELTQDKYIARLWQFVFEKVGKKSSGGLLLAQINDLGDRIDKIHSLSSKGVHADVSKFEVNQCVIQTYLVIGDILRIYDGDTALDSKDVT